MTRMTGPDCAVMCTLINTHTFMQYIASVRNERIQAHNQSTFRSTGNESSRASPSTRTPFTLNKRNVCRPPLLPSTTPVARAQMVFVSGDCGGAGSHLNEDVGTISSQLPVTVEGSTRVDITKRLDHDLGDGSTTSPAQTVHDPIKI